MNKEKIHNNVRWFSHYVTRDVAVNVPAKRGRDVLDMCEPRARGFTLVETVISMVVMIIAAFAIGAIVANGQSGWNAMYDKIHSDVVTEGFSVRKKFDAVIRKASSDKIFIGADNSSVKVYYYSSDVSTVVDRYAQFYVSDGDLNLEYGTLDPKVTLNVETVCSKVTKCTFHQFGRAVQMILTLDNGAQKNTVITSAVTNN
jgi:Tfp pilus assembly protein PilV